MWRGWLPQSTPEFLAGNEETKFLHSHQTNLRCGEVPQEDDELYPTRAKVVQT